MLYISFRGKDVCVIQLQYFGDDEERLNRLHVDSPACVSELEICIVSDLSSKECNMALLCRKQETL